MNFEYLDSKQQSINIDKYNKINKPKVISLFYKAGCDAYIIMACYYYNKKVNVLDKYYEKNIETKIKDYYTLYESAYLLVENQCYDIYTSEILEEYKKISEDVKEECNKIYRRRTSFKKAFKYTKKENLNIISENKYSRSYNKKILWVSIASVFFIAITAYFTYDNKSKPEVNDIKPPNLQSNANSTIEFFSISERFNTNIIMYDLTNKKLILNKTIQRISSQVKKDNNLKIELKSNYLFCLGNIYSSFKLQDKVFDIQKNQNFIKNGLHFIYIEKKLRQISYTEYKDYLNKLY